MSLDEELRSTFDLAAERCTAPPPDVVGLIHAGRARRRRRTLTRAAASVAASMAVGAATFGLVTSDLRVDGDVVSPPRPSPTTELDTPSDD